MDRSVFSLSRVWPEARDADCYFRYRLRMMFQKIMELDADQEDASSASRLLLAVVDLRYDHVA